MTRFQRYKQIFSAVITLITAGLILSSPTEGYKIVIYVLAIVFAFRGVTNIVYYFSMARFMVGGRTSLYIGVILLDLGFLTLTLTDVPHYYILLYLIAIHAFSGIVEMLRAFEARRVGAGSWKLKMCHGIINILIALAGIVFIRRLNVAVIIYCSGLVYSSVLRIISACRSNRPVYIQ